MFIHAYVAPKYVKSNKLIMSTGPTPLPTTEPTVTPPSTPIPPLLKGLFTYTLSSNATADTI